MKTNQMLNAFHHEQAPANAIRSTGKGSLSHQQTETPIDFVSGAFRALGELSVLSL